MEPGGCWQRCSGGMENVGFEVGTGISALLWSFLVSHPNLQIIQVQDDLGSFLIGFFYK